MRGPRPLDIQENLYYDIMIPGSEIRCRLACKKMFDLGTRQKHEKEQKSPRSTDRKKNESLIHKQTIQIHSKRQAIFPHCPSDPALRGSFPAPAAGSPADSGLRPVVRCHHLPDDYRKPGPVHGHFPIFHNRTGALPSHHPFHRLSGPQLAQTSQNFREAFAWSLPLAFPFYCQLRHQLLSAALFRPQRPHRPAFLIPGALRSVQLAGGADPGLCPGAVL